MDFASVTVQLEVADIQQFRDYLGKSRKGAGRRFYFYLLGGIVALFLYHSALGNHGEQRSSKVETHTPVEQLTDVVPVLVVIGLVAFYLWRSTRPANYRKHVPHLFLPHTYSVRQDGLFHQNSRGEGVDYWSAILRFAETDQHFFVLLTEHTGHVLPKRCFPTLEAAAIFANQMRLHVEDRFVVRAPVVRSPGQAIVG